MISDHYVYWRVKTCHFAIIRDFWQPCLSFPVFKCSHCNQVDTPWKPERLAFVYIWQFSIHLELHTAVFGSGVYERPLNRVECPDLVQLCFNRRVPQGFISLDLVKKKMLLFVKPVRPVKVWTVAWLLSVLRQYFVDLSFNQTRSGFMDLHRRIKSLNSSGLNLSSVHSYT